MRKIRLKTSQFQKVFRGWYPQIPTTGRGWPPPRLSPSTAYSRVPRRKHPGCWDLCALRTPSNMGRLRACCLF